MLSAVAEATPRLKAPSLLPSLPVDRDPGPLAAWAAEERAPGAGDKWPSRLFLGGWRVHSGDPLGRQVFKACSHTAPGLMCEAGRGRREGPRRAGTSARDTAA